MALKLNDLYQFAKMEYQDYLYCNNKPHLNKALEYYNEYKNRNGKKVIKELESR